MPGDQNQTQLLQGVVVGRDQFHQATIRRDPDGRISALSAFGSHTAPDKTVSLFCQVEKSTGLRAALAAIGGCVSQALDTYAPPVTASLQHGGVVGKAVALAIAVPASKVAFQADRMEAHFARHPGKLEEVAQVEHGPGGPVESVILHQDGSVDYSVNGGGSPDEWFLSPGPNRHSGASQLFDPARDPYRG
ncbi:MAG: hypothetical protein AB1758_07190 [Candidatus Eremiobacterota bacterium]